MIVKILLLITYELDIYIKGNIFFKIKNKTQKTRKPNFKWMEKKEAQPLYKMKVTFAQKFRK